MPRALHDFVASLDSRAYFTMAVFREFVLVFYKAKAVSLLRKKGEKKRRRRDQLGFNTLNVFTRFSFQNFAQNAREKGAKEEVLEEEDKEG